MLQQLVETASFSRDLHKGHFRVTGMGMVDRILEKLNSDFGATYLSQSTLRELERNFTHLDERERGRHLEPSSARPPISRIELFCR
jgi:hypothetical protein